MRARTRSGGLGVLWASGAVTPRSRRAYLNSLEIYDREGPGTLVDFVFHRVVEAMTQAFDILTASALS